MGSNTSKGVGEKGSKFWIQKLVNLDKGKVLSNHINDLDNTIRHIEWLSPLEENNYNEIKNLRDINKDERSLITEEDLNFWPNRGPWWDAVGLCEDDNTIILVEVKGHIKETYTKCSAISNKSKELIGQTLKEVYESISTNKVSTDDWENSKSDIWHNEYYQVANRLAFLIKLKEKGKKIKLILLNIVGDSSHIKTSENEWIKHYEKISNDMGVDLFKLDDVIILNFDVNKL